MDSRCDGIVLDSDFSLVQAHGGSTLEWRACGFGGPPPQDLEMRAMKTPREVQIPMTLYETPRLGTLHGSASRTTRVSGPGQCIAKHGWPMVSRGHAAPDFVPTRRGLYGDRPIMPGSSKASISRKHRNGEKKWYRGHSLCCSELLSWVCGEAGEVEGGRSRRSIPAIFIFTST